MPFITQTLLNDNRLQIGREEFVRPHAWGGQWRKLRIGLHWAMNATPGIEQATSGVGVFASANFTYFFLGLCQGSTGYSSPSTPDALVASPFTQGGVRSSFTNNFSAPYNYYSVFFNPGRFIWKQGTVENSITAGSLQVFGACTPARQQLFLDIAFVNTNTVSWNIWGPGSSAHAITDISRFAFLQAMEMDTGMPNVSQWTSNALQNYAGNFSLDSVCLYWERSIPTFEISEIAVTRFF